MPIIQASALTRSFPGPGGPIAALGPLDLSVADGEFVCIVGPSGCGKSTFLRLVAGLDESTGGDLTLTAPKESERPFNAMVFQGDSTFPWMTVYENVEYGLRMQGVRDKQRAATVAEMLGVVGLGGFAEAYPYQLSGGMRQRVALARAFANDPNVLLMDEPFGALDEQNRILLQEELLRIWERSDVHANSGRGKTVLFVTHSIDEALVLADRVLVMSAAPGRIVDEIRVPFARPRRVYELKRDPLFGELAYRIWQKLRAEVNQSRGEGRSSA